MTKENPMNELELIAKIKAGVIEMENDMRRLQAMQVDGGRHRAADACGALLIGLMKWHQRATRALFKHYPEHADEIQTKGPRR